ncbi:MAG TPA: phosphohistidine phosphatase SixA [Desulfobacterales bacterium]|nr:phosphohistidine phosphatase SixA [Desulfobacterales bacterium]
MRLYLVQHGEALNAADDSGKTLSPKGRRDVKALAEACAKRHIEAVEVIHSGKVRARQTAEMLAAALNLPVRAETGLDPMDPVRPFAGECATMHSTVVVGHQPFLERLAALLLAGREDPPVLAFQRGGMACLERRGAPHEGWCILWTAFPDQVHPGG